MIIEERNIILDEWHITIKDFGDKRVISDADKVNMPSEDRLVIGRVRGGYDVYVEHRYSREDITFEKDEETAILWGIIAYIRRFRNVINQEESDYIMKCAIEGAQEGIEQSMETVSAYISAKNETNRVSYKDSDGRYMIAYNKETICENVSKERAAALLYNYASFLRCIEEFIEKHNRYIEEIGIDVEELKRYFVTKRKYLRSDLGV